MLLMLFTATRREEAAGAVWGEMDLEAKLWTIPAERIKRPNPKRPPEPHIVPLSKQALAFLKARQPANAAQDALVFQSEIGTELGHWDRVTKSIQKKASVDGWHRHDLRRTAATSMGKLGVPPYVVEAALNHADVHSPLAGVYNLARYIEEVGDSLQKCADWLTAIEIEKNPITQAGWPELPTEDHDEAETMAD
jgi:integrase